jgi:hypothetical protein
MHVLLSTTTGWNPGDEFIRFGCLYLLETVLGRRVTQGFFDRNEAYMKCHPHLPINRWRATTPAHFDLIVLAGSPDWGKSNDELYRLAPSAPLVALGLGAASQEHLQEHVHQGVVDILKSAALVTTRDEMAHEFLNARGVTNTLLPCPAIFAAHHCGLLGDPQHDTIATIASRSDLEQWPQVLEHKPLICCTHLDFHAFVQAGAKPLYDAEPRRLLELYLAHAGAQTSKLHAALPMLGAKRQARIFDHADERVQRGWQTAQTLTVDETRARYLELLQAAL